MPEIVKMRTTRYVITQVAVDFLTFNERYREIREPMRYQGFECYNCGCLFQDGEKLSLAITSKGNKVVCRACGEMFHAELDQVGEVS